MYYEAGGFSEFKRSNSAIEFALGANRTGADSKRVILEFRLSVCGQFVFTDHGKGFFSGRDFEPLFSKLWYLPIGFRYNL